ncbi:MAG: N-acetylmuramoyl-L-alanine amidase [Ferruginibacter sp.]
MKFLFTFLGICVTGIVFSQADNSPFIRLINPSKNTISVKSSRQFIIGSTCKSCTLSINKQPVKVYATGAFAYELNLAPGDSAITILSESSGKSLAKKINYSFSLPVVPEPVKMLGIESIRTYPEGDLELMPGDNIKFRVKAFPKCTVRAMQNLVLYEMPLAQTNGMPGIYQGEYMVKATDSFVLKKIPVSIKDSAGNTISKETSNRFTIRQSTQMVITTGRLAHLEYGLGDDRLGGAKIGYLDSNIILKIVGKVGEHYKVQLAKNRTAYIPDELVKKLPAGVFTPESLTTNWNVYGDEKYDYVRIGLFAKLPYQSFQLVDPSRIVVDIFGATNNTNWITQLQTVKEIKNVFYEQKEDDVFRIVIELKHAQHWGHQLYYSGNSLIIKVKQQPKSLSLKNLTIAIDAGHGGTNSGAVGATGIYEKELALAVALKLQKSLEKQEAKVIMSRTTETFFDNKERILFYRDSMPDLLISIHLNSSDDPIRTGGTATFYRYIGFRNLSLGIYKRMLELGLKEYGNTGSFNFMLNSPTEYPNALVETLFLSNLEEEMKILNPEFQQQMADKIVAGIKDFLESCK